MTVPPTADFIAVSGSQLWLFVAMIVFAISMGVVALKRSVRNAASRNASQVQALEGELSRLRSATEDPVLAEESLRKQALAEALRREPDLAASHDPDSSQRLAALVATIREELRLQRDIERLKRDEEERTAMEARQAQAIAQRKRYEQQVASWGPLRRMMVQRTGLFILLIVGAAGLLYLALAAVAAAIGAR